MWLVSPRSRRISRPSARSRRGTRRVSVVVRTEARGGAFVRFVSGCITASWGGPGKGGPGKGGPGKGGPGKVGSGKQQPPAELVGERVRDAECDVGDQRAELGGELERVPR